MSKAYRFDVSDLEIMISPVKDLEQRIIYEFVKALPEFIAETVKYKEELDGK